MKNALFLSLVLLPAVAQIKGENPFSGINENLVTPVVTNTQQPVPQKNLAPVITMPEVTNPALYEKPVTPPPSTANWSLDALSTALYTFGGTISSKAQEAAQWTWKHLSDAGSAVSTRVGGWYNTCSAKLSDLNSAYQLSKKFSLIADTCKSAGESVVAGVQAHPGVAFVVTTAGIVAFAYIKNRKKQPTQATE